MKTKGDMKRVWYHGTLSALVTAVGLAMTGCGKSTMPSETSSPTQSAHVHLSGEYEHFLYLRHDLEGSSAKTDSLVLVRVTRDGFVAKPVYSKMNLAVGWHPLGVANGKLYGIRMGALMSVDLQAGTAAEIEGEWTMGSWTWSDGKLYAFVKDGSLPQANLLRVYDAETESHRDIGVEPNPAPPGVALMLRWPPKPQVSPDHKWLAYFYRSTDITSSYIHQLRLMAVDDGKVKTSEISVAAREFQGGGIGSESSPPFCWLDSRTLLVVRDASTNHLSTFWDDHEDGMADMILARVDIGVDRMTDICRLPRFKPDWGEPFFRIGHKGEVPRLVIGRLGQYRIDLAGRRLVPGAGIGGSYSYTRGSSAGEPDELRFKDNVLESGMVIPEVAVSPDGLRIAWHGRPVVRPPWDAQASKIRFHDSASGQTRTVEPGCWIPDTWRTDRPSFEGNLLWISTRKLTPMSQTNVPAGWKRFSP